MQYTLMHKNNIIKESVNGAKALVVSRWGRTSGISQPQKEVLYTLFVQLGQIQLCNIKAFLVSAKNQEEFKRIPVGTNCIAAQISLDGQIVCKVLRQKFGEVRCFHWTPPSGE